MTRPLPLWPVLVGLATLTACFDEPGVDTSPVVFEDDLRGVGFQAFANSRLDALSRDTTEKHSGVASLRIDVPQPGSGSGGYAGGAFVAESARDLSGFNALVLWAKASQAVKVDVFGLGNDNTGTSLYEASIKRVDVGTEWKRILLPLPLASKLAEEKGLFYFAAAPQGAPATGYTVWLDDLVFATLDETELGPPRPSITSRSISRQIGDPILVPGTRVTFTAQGADVAVDASPNYFRFVSSNDAVVTFGDAPTGTALSAGTATITGMLGEVAATGAVTVEVLDVARPNVAAPTPPARQAADVISLFSGAYTNVPVATWRAEYSQVELYAELPVAGDATKKYSGLLYAGIELGANPLNAEAMTHFHLDVWTPDATTFKVKLVDFGANAAYGGGDDAEHELTFTPSSTPALLKNAWVSLDLPLTSFTGLTQRGHLAQLIVSSADNTVYIDNVYFHR